MDGTARPATSSAALAKLRADLDAGIVAAREALDHGDNARASRVLDELEEGLEAYRGTYPDASTTVDAAGELTPAQADDGTLSWSDAELEPGWQCAEDVNREMERIRARREAREQVVGKPAVLVSTTDGGPLRYRDEHGNVGPLPRSRARERLAAEMERFSRLSRPEQRRYEVLGAVREQRAGVHPPVRPRQSRARPRTRARRAAHRGASRAGPGDDDSGESEPAGVAHACRRSIAGGRP